jgi:GDP-mannose 6-dehydrogenase
MKISVLGLGYVGCVSAGCLAQEGHEVIGVDVNPVKVDLINRGESPIIETGIDEIIQEAVSAGQLAATLDGAHAVSQSDISLLCVGTPSRSNGSLDVQYLRNASRDVGRGLRKREGYHVVVIRSTVLPHTTESVVIPAIEEEADKQVGEDFGACVNPEFLREGSAVADYYDPAFTLIGSWDERSGDLLEMVYEPVDAPVIRSDIRTAEMVKYVSNGFHALKIAFANEVGILCKELEVDSHEVMDVFVQDTRLNISPKYLQPGFAFGGSCLPKDLRAVIHRARTLDLDLPVLNAILPSNDRQIERAYQMVSRVRQKKVGILGLSFKAGTDDLRESPMVRLAERLLGKGYDLQIYDKEVSMAKVVGANKGYIEKAIPHISDLLVRDIDQVLSHAEVLVIGHSDPEFKEALERVKDKPYLVDLVRIRQDSSLFSDGRYEGICW